MKKLPIICVLMSSLVLSGCGTIVGALGFSSTVVETANIVSVSTSVYDAGALVFEVKTLSDHAVSVALSEDCRMIRLLTDKQICQPEAGNIELAKHIEVASQAATWPPDMNLFYSVYTWDPNAFPADLPIH
jgi:hypothetical protein